eukprot:scaffold1033_cov408-Prasinococcus_capsulatus_cf.AAC.3
MQFGQRALPNIRSARVQVKLKFLGLSFLLAYFPFATFAILVSLPRSCCGKMACLLSLHPAGAGFGGFHHPGRGCRLVGSLRRALFGVLGTPSESLRWYSGDSCADWQLADLQAKELQKAAAIARARSKSEFRDAETSSLEGGEDLLSEEGSEWMDQQSSQLDSESAGFSISESEREGERGGMSPLSQPSVHGAALGLRQRRVGWS